MTSATDKDSDYTLTTGDIEDLFKFDGKPSGKPSFASETEEAHSDPGQRWKVLVVDDEEDVHAVTHLALEGFELLQRRIQFLDAYNAREAEDLLRQHPDVAIILLDVVMETTHAGLDLVKFVRDELGNRFARIILRTGQPGEAPEREVIRAYQINDYKTKTELTSDKLYTAVLASLRTYEAMVTIEAYRKTLELKVRERTSDLENSLEELKQAHAEIVDLERKNTALAMAVTTSHEINQPLMVIKGSVDLILMNPSTAEGDEALRRHLDKIDGACETIRRIIERLHNLDHIHFENYAANTPMVALENDDQ